MLQLLAAQSAPLSGDAIMVICFGGYVIVGLILFPTMEVWDPNEKFGPSILVAFFWPLVILLLPFYLVYKLFYNINKRIKDFVKQRH